MRQIYLTFLLALTLLPSVALSQTDFEFTKSMAELGYAEDQFNLGNMYEDGIGVARNSFEAVKWFRLAAEQGHVESQYNLGINYYSGLGVTQNYPEAVKWFSRAAEQGLAEAQYNLGIMLDKGLGIEQSLFHAYVLWSVAATQGLEDAIVNRDIMAKRLQLLAPGALADAQCAASRCWANGKLTVPLCSLPWCQ